MQTPTRRYQIHTLLTPCLIIWLMFLVFLDSTCCRNLRLLLRKAQLMILKRKKKKKRHDCFRLTSTEQGVSNLCATLTYIMVNGWEVTRWVPFTDLWPLPWTMRSFRVLTNEKLPPPQANNREFDRGWAKSKVLYLTTAGMMVVEGVRRGSAWRRKPPIVRWQEPARRKSVLAERPSWGGCPARPAPMSPEHLFTSTLNVK